MTCAFTSAEPANFSVAPAEIRDSNILLYSSTRMSLGLRSRWVRPKYTLSTKRTRLPKKVLPPVSFLVEAFSNCLSHSNPAKGVSVQFPFLRNEKSSSIVCQVFRQLYRGTRIHSRNSDLGSFSNIGASSILTLAVCGYGVTCSSSASK